VANDNNNNNKKNKNKKIIIIIRRRRRRRMSIVRATWRIWLKKLSGNVGCRQVYCINLALEYLLRSWSYFETIIVLTLGKYNPDSRGRLKIKEIYKNGYDQSVSAVVGIIIIFLLYVITLISCFDCCCHSCLSLGQYSFSYGRLLIVFLYLSINISLLIFHNS